MKIKSVQKSSISVRFVAAACLAALLLICGISALGASALGGDASETDAYATASYEYTEPSLAYVASRSVWQYKSYSASAWGSKLKVNALLINGELYIPMRTLAEKIGLKVSYSSRTRTLTVSGDGLAFSVSDGAYVAYANERPLFSRNSSVIMSDGRMYVPIDTAMKAFGLSYSFDSAKGVSVFGSYSPLIPASQYYRSDEVLWLSRIISAESRGEPLLGQIAVGTVVMNRVASASYPNTIYGVIFDRRYGVQFSPVLDGTVYNTPTYNCILAAKICLEGVRVGEGALFFLRPEASDSLWIPATKKYLFSIGNHDFYA